MTNLTVLDLQQRYTRGRVRGGLLIASAVGVTVLSLYCIRAASGLSQHRQLTPSTECLEFIEYLPSVWESRWLNIGDQPAKPVCQLMADDKAQARIWIEDLARADAPQYNTSTGITNPHGVWSFFKYRDWCSPSTMDMVHVPIEPAVGLLRHPFAAPCESFHANQRSFDVQDREYLLLATEQFIKSFPGKKYLLDLGTGTSFASSLQWFVDKYKQRGVVFDEIWCWEATPTEAQTYWQSVPEEYVAKVHFYNTFATHGLHASAPLGILQGRYQKGDYVVVKLDIDNDALEDQILHGLLELRHAVGELFFEKHFDNEEMHPYFGDDLKTGLHETLKLFQQFRRVGARLHYWP